MPTVAGGKAWSGAQEEATTPSAACRWPPVAVSIGLLSYDVDYAGVVFQLERLQRPPARDLEERPYVAV